MFQIDGVANKKKELSKEGMVINSFVNFMSSEIQIWKFKALKCSIVMKNISI